MFAALCLSLLSSLILLQSSVRMLSNGLGYTLIERNRQLVRDGFQKTNWISKDVLWFNVQGCYLDGTLDTIGARAECLVCSIDDVGGQIYDNKNMLFRGQVAPANAVAITASTGRFLRSPDGWQFTEFTPFASNYLASNNHPYLRYNLNNLKKTAPSECREMESMKEFVIRR